MAEVRATPRWGPEAPQLHAHGLVLTALQECDAEALFAMDRDPEIARRFDWDPDNATLANCQVYRAHLAGVGNRRARRLRCPRIGGGALLATVEARRADDGRVELSWMTVRDQRGKDVASRAVFAICHWWARVEHDNAASLRVAHSCGMREHHRDSRWVHLVPRGDG